MALEKVLVPVDLSGSLNTKTDQKMVLQSELTGLENGVFRTGSTITKRNGYSSLRREVAGSSTAISSGDALATFQKELLLFSGSTLFSYASGFRQWVDKGSTQSVTVTSDDIIRNDFEQSSPDISFGNGQILTAWEDTQGGIRASVRDSSTGALIQNNTLINATGILPRCIELDGRVGVLYIDTTGTDTVKLRQISVSDPTTFSSETSLTTDSATSGHQIAVTKFGTAAICAYADSSSKIKVMFITADGEVGSILNGYVAPIQINALAEDCLAIMHDGENDGHYYVAYGKSTSGTGLKITRLDQGLAEIQTITAEATSTAIKHVTMSLNSSNNIEVIYEHNAGQLYNRFIKKGTITWHASSSSMDTPAVLKRSVGLASKAFLYNSKVYFAVCHESSLQSTYFLLDSTGLIVAKMSAGTAGGIQTDPTLASIVSVNTGVYEIPVQVKTRLVSRDNDLYSLKGISKAELDFTTTSNFDTEELGLNLLSGGGFVSNYDGHQIAEHGFHLYPENVSVAVSSGGSLTSGQAYQFRVCYVHTDAQGQIYRSAPSVAVTASPTGSNLTADLTIPTLRVTSHSNVICEVFRTVGNGTNFYKVGTVANSTSADTVSFSDPGTINDTNLLAQEILYTTGGVLEHVTPPATSVIGSFANRMFAVSSENPKVLFYSQKRTKGNPVEFSDSLYITFNKAQSITALAEMDEKLIIFEDDRIFYLTGSGPNATGQQNNFSDPQLITSDVGCSNTRSIVQMPNGLMFMSNKGIYLLDRGLSTHYIGAPVEEYNSLTITSAILIQDENQVRFTASDGVALVYDYFVNKWSTFTNHQANGAVTWLEDGSYVYLRTSGGLCYQQSSNFDDVGAAIQMKIVTAWIKPASIQGFQRVRRAVVLGDFKSNHTLQSRVAYNFRQYYNEEHLFNFIDDLGVNEYGDENPYGSELYGAGTDGHADGVYQFRFHLNGPQKCDSIRFEFSDTVNTDPGQAYSISNLMLEIGLKNTAVKLPSYKTV